MFLPLMHPPASCLWAARAATSPCKSTTASPGKHISDQGSIKVQLVQPADRVELILVNRADHPVPASYQDGV
jgi:hypothetical protein